MTALVLDDGCRSEQDPTSISRANAVRAHTPFTCTASAPLETLVVVVVVVVVVGGRGR